MAEEKKPEGGGGVEWPFVLIMISAVLAVIVPALVSTASFFILRKHINKLAASIVALTGGVSFALLLSTSVKDYFIWLVSLVGQGPGAPLQAPWLFLASAVMLLTGLAIAIQDTRVASAGLAKIGGKKAPSSLSVESVIPTSEQKEQIAVVKTPKPILTNASQNSITRPVEPGKRFIPLGTDKAGKVVGVHENEIGTHGILLGSTGSGKSKTIEALAGGLLDLGWDGMIIDLKEDVGLKNWSAEYASAHAIPFQDFRLGDTQPRFYFNALDGMGPDQARDTILSLNELNDAYWAAINQKQLGQLCGLFWDAHSVDPVAYPIPTMKEIGRLLTKEDLRGAVKNMVAAVVASVPGRTTEDFSAFMTPSKAEKEAAGGLGARLLAAFETQAGRIVMSPGDNRSKIDVTQQGLTYMGLDSLGMPELAKMVSTAVLLRMAVLAAQRTAAKDKPGVKEPRKHFIIIDEANFINRTVVMNILSRARSAGIAVVLATQGAKDFETGGPGQPGFDVLAQNTNVSIIMSQGELKNAEMAADLIGMHERYDISHSIVDDDLAAISGAKKVRDYIVSPDEIRKMGIGEAIIRVGKPTHSVTWTKIAMRDPRAKATRT